MSLSLTNCGGIELLDLHPRAADFHGEFLAGLRGDPKSLPSKFFYDAAGSALFEEICELPEYYPTRVEIGLLRAHAPEIAALIGPGACMVEPGSGSTRKAEILLEHLREPAAYVPVEISRSALLAAAERLRSSHPALRVMPVCADYTAELHLPRNWCHGARSSLIFFPGSTIGNFVPAEAGRFLALLARMVGGSGSLLVGVDLRKDRHVLEAAYNDPGQVTARFNKNILARANRELDARFDLDAFDHSAIYDARRGRIEMRLISRKNQAVAINGSTIHFERGEPILTEVSYKYSVGGFRRLAASAGFRPVRVWADLRRRFSLHLLAFG
jgi:L-histidine Nalpha-methyltransferase